MLFGLLGFVMLMIINSLYDLDNLAYMIDPNGGPNVGVDLVNDTPDVLRFALCSRDNCNKVATSEVVQPGDSHRVTTEPDDPAWWMVTDMAGKGRGCFHLDIDLADRGKDFLATRLETCPRS